MKRLLLLALVLIGTISMMAQTTYELTVAGTTVTSANCNDILGNGKVTYDAANKTLTLNSLVYAPTKPAIESYIPDLKINVESNNILKAPIRLHANTTIEGTGTMIVQPSRGNAISFSGGALTIKDVKLGVPESSCAIYGDTDNSSCVLTVSNARMELNGSQEAIHVRALNLEGETGVMTENAIWSNSKYGYVDATGTLITSLKLGTVYPLQVADKQVNEDNKDDILGNGKAVYDAANKILTLDSYANIDGETYSIKSEVDGLTIKVNGLVSADKSLRLKGSTTIEGRGDFFIYSQALFGIWFSDGSLTVKGVRMIISGSNTGISGTVADERCALYFKDNADVEITTKVANNTCAIKANALYFDDYLGIDSPGVVWSDTDHRTVDKDGNNAKEVSIGKASYPIWVAGTQVTKDNLNDILGDGTVSYNPSHHVLTFSGAYITAPSGTPVVKAEGELWVMRMEGTCSFEANDAVCFDLNTVNGFTIEGGERAVMFSTGSKDHAIFKAEYLAIINLSIEALNGVFYDGRGKGRLNIQNSQIVHAVNNDKITSSIIGIENMYIDEPSELVYPNSIVYDSKNARYEVRDFAITIDNYLVRINNSYINKYNAADVLGDGTVSYDKETNTLTLNNADIDILCSSLDNLTISLTGENHLNTLIDASIDLGSYDFNMAWANSQNMKIISDGGKTYFLRQTKFLIQNNLTLENVNAEYKDTRSYNTIFNVDGQLTLKNCNITYDPTTTDAKPFLLNNPIEFIGCEFTKPSTSEYVRFDPEQHTYTVYGSTPIKYFEITSTKVYYWGDIDHNGIIDMRDVVYMNRILMDRAVDAYGNADINHDTKIDTKDVNALVDIILGKREPEVLK